MKGNNLSEDVKIMRHPQKSSKWRAKNSLMLISAPYLGAQNRVTIGHTF